MLYDQITKNTNDWAAKEREITDAAAAAGYGEVDPVKDDFENAFGHLTLNEWNELSRFDVYDIALDYFKRCVESLK